MYIQFAELPVTDQDRAKAFYVEMLDCEVAADAPMGDDGWRWIELKFPGTQTNLHFIHRGNEAPSEMPVLVCLLYTSPSPRDRTRSRMPSSA